MNSEFNKISILKVTPFDKLRANGINQSVLNNQSLRLCAFVFSAFNTNLYLGEHVFNYV